MRFSVELMLEGEMIPKDKNRIIISLLKHCFSSYDKEYYMKLYDKAETKAKEFTFSLYMGDCKFLREEIQIPGKKMILNFSAYSYKDGIMFYNSFLSSKGKQYPIKGNIITIGNLKLIKEKMIYDDEAIFITKSPIVVREHEGDNNKTWYHTLNSEDGMNVFKKNLKYQLRDALGEKVLYDFKDVDIKLIGGSKEVKVKNYGIEVLSNIVKFKVKAKPYILDYMYKAGIGSKRASGFGLLEIV